MSDEPENTETKFIYFSNNSNFDKVCMRKESWQRTFIIFGIILVCCLIIALSFWKTGEAKPMSDISYRIVFGRQAKPKEFPYHTLIVAPFDMVYSHCGGTIINKNWILTAAHCILSLPQFAVIAGKIFLKNLTEGQIRYSSQLFIHPDYINDWYRYDIGLIYSDNPWEYNDFVQPAQLPSEDEDELGKCIAVGWGSTTYNCSIVPSDILLVGSIEIEKMNDSLLFSKVITINSNDLPSDTCFGDSGGGLVKKNLEGEYIVIGVTSSGPFPCHKPLDSSVYTRVKHFLKWIDDTIENKTKIS